MAAEQRFQWMPEDAELLDENAEHDEPHPYYWWSGTRRNIRNGST
jgi:hypothetical protein